MALTDRIQEFLQRLTPLTRSCLLTELERLQTSDGEMPGTADILARLRAEFRKDGSTQNRLGMPSRYFFAPLEPLPRQRRSRTCQFRADPARLAGPRSWEWISRDLLRTMAGDYIKKIEELTLAKDQKQAAQVAAAFQVKVVKYLESTLGSPDGAEQTRKKLAGLYGVALGLRRPDQDTGRATRTRCAGKIQRGAADRHPEVR